MKLEFFEAFQDPYLQNNDGRGVFLCGIVLGMVARGQAGKGNPVDSAPMFKQLNFGKVQRRDLLKHMARIPELVRVYKLDYAGMIESLCARSGELLLQGEHREPGIDGNFAFSIAFLNAPDYFFKKIFPKKEEEEKTESSMNSLKEGN